MGKLVDLKDFMTKMGIPYQDAKNDDNAVLIKPEIKLSNRKELCARIGPLSSYRTGFLNQILS